MALRYGCLNNKTDVVGVIADLLLRRRWFVVEKAVVDGIEAVADAVTANIANASDVVEVIVEAEDVERWAPIWS